VRAALVIAGKDLHQRLRDRSAILLGLVVPLGLAFVFKLVFGGIATEGMRFPYAVADVDGGPVAAVLIDEVLAPLAAEGLIELHTAGTEAAARALVAGGEVEAAFVIPAGFSEVVSAGEAAALEVIASVDAPMGAQVARAIAEAFTADLDTVRIAVAAALRSQPGLGAAEVAQRAAVAPAPVWVEDVSATMRELSPTTYLAAGMAVFFLFFTVQFGVVSLLEERREGTLARLRAAPIARLSILGGKLLTSFLLGVLSMSALVLATSVLLGARWGHPVGVALLIVAGVLAATAVTALVASLATTAEQAGNAQAIIAVLLGLLGGAFFPIGQAGGLMATLSLGTPHAWFLRGLGELAGGAGPAAALPAAGAILAFAGVTGALALTRLGKVVRA
jgi:ABC-2 type transport system permease protein